VRIISGKYRGKIIMAPAGLPSRPTTDFAKTGLFNILNNLVDYEKIKVLDLFSGTGNIAYEFISRGTKQLTIVDSDKNCIKFISETVQKLKAEETIIIKADAFSFIANNFQSFDLVFADPPFEMQESEKLPDLVFKHQLIQAEGMFILEHASGKDFSPHPFFSQVRKYGHVSFSFFSHPLSSN
jgi:16S rRNA (guanine966-N2)-methyltransferase